MRLGLALRLGTTRVHLHLVSRVASLLAARNRLAHPCDTRADRDLAHACNEVLSRVSRAGGSSLLATAIVFEDIARGGLSLAGGARCLAMADWLLEVELSLVLFDCGGFGDVGLREVEDVAHL